MRIGVVSTSYPREAGDPAGLFVAGFARWLVEAGADVEVIAAGPGQAWVDGIGVTRVDGAGLFYGGGAPDALAGSGHSGAARVGLALERGRAWGRAAAFQAALAVAVARRIEHWDGVVSHWLAPSALAVAASLVGRACRPRHLAVAHSSDVWLLNRSRIGRAAVRELSRRADLVYAARHLVVDGAPGRVVAMGVTPVAASDRSEARRRWGLSDEKTARPCALFLGRLVPVKGVELLLAALPDELDLLVAGDGPLRTDLIAQAAGDRRIRFVGEVRDGDKRLLLAAADVLVVPSRVLADGRTEGTPTVVLEALAAGLPIVATRAGGLADVLSDGETALLVDADGVSLRAALVRIARDADLRARLAEGARRAGLDHGWDRVGPRLAGRLLDGAQSRSHTGAPITLR